jgi:hypothetical protein
MDEIKAWKCENGHVMGQIVKNGRGVTRLLLYREAVNLVAPQAISSQTPTPCGAGASLPSPEDGRGSREEGIGDVDVMAVIEGYAVNIVCSKCGCIRSWVPGEEALRKMLTQFQRMHAGEKVG